MSLNPGRYHTAAHQRRCPGTGICLDCKEIRQRLYWEKRKAKQQALALPINPPKPPALTREDISSLQRWLLSESFLMSNYIDSSGNHHFIRREEWEVAAQRRGLDGPFADRVPGEVIFTLAGVGKARWNLEHSKGVIEK